MANSLETQLQSLAALDEPVRRKLYLYVAQRGEEVGRDEAAEVTGVSRALAAFHLDKLVEAGLLEPTFRRLSGRDGPGAGRPSKLYRRSAAQFDVSLPRRRYELAAHVLTRAMAKAPAQIAQANLREAAFEWGKQLAAEHGATKGRGKPLGRAARVLGECGFEPQASKDEVVLRNCPFDTLRNESRELVCGFNHALIEGLLTGLGVEGVRASLEPQPGRCCVKIRAQGGQ